MSFDYGSDGNKFNLPNPLRLENVALMISGAALLLGGLVNLFLVKSAMAAESSRHVGGVLILSIGMLSAGVFFQGWAMRQLRFFFGRGRPRSLAQDVPNSMQGKSGESDALREHLRQQALHYQEPKGALSNLIHSLIPNLTFAPAPVRSLALHQFKSAITLILVLVALGLCLVGGKTQAANWSHVADWIGVGFLVFIVWKLLSPAARAMSLSVAVMEESLSPQRLVMLIVGAVIGPVLLLKIAPSLPDVTFIDPYPQVFILLALALASYGLFFLALVRNVRTPPSTVVTSLQDTWSINCHPGLALDEFGREMQTAWVENTPNRVYSRLQPQIDLNQKAGTFYAEAMEETQPLPINSQSLTVATVNATPQLQPLLWLDIVGTFFICLGTILLALAGNRLIADGATNIPSNLLTYGIVFLSLGFYQIAAAHTLWRRFEFKSHLTCMEMSGHYITAQMDHGNLMRDTVKTNSHVVQVESMTFRLWVTEVTSVIFDKDAPRYILSLAGEAARANQLASHIKSFAQEQAIILAPKAQADQVRHSTLGAFNERPASLPSNAGETLVPLPRDTDTAVDEKPAVVLAPTATRYCSACGASLTAHAAFCSACGTKAAA